MLSTQFTLPLTIVMAIQAVMTMASYSLPVVIPVAAPDLGIHPESVGFLVATVYLLGMITGLFTSVVIARLGPTQTFQLMLVLTFLAITLLSSSAPFIAIVAVVILGCAAGPMNPSGSHVLAAVVPVRHRSFIFSLKQCATPAGGILAGVILPPLMLAFGWQTALLIIPVLAVILMFCAPFGRLGNRSKTVVSSEPVFRQIKQSIVLVMSDPAIRSVTFAAVALAIGQMGCATYLVVYLWREVGFSEAAAGLVFALLHLSGIGSRLMLGFVADRLTSAKWVLVGICIALTVSLLLIAQFTADWPVAVIYATVILAGASGNGWVGLYFSELARLSPQEKVAEVAGGSQFFTYAGLVLGPLLFGALLRLSDSYTLTFSVVAGIALIAAVGLARVRTAAF